MKRRFLSVLLSLVLLAACLPMTFMNVFALSGSASYAVGEDVKWTIYEATESVDSIAIVGGSLPDGLSVEKTDKTVYITGKPTNTGSYECTIEIGYNAGSFTEYTATFAITTFPILKITKHPIGEIVTEGDRTYFTASADNYVSATWQLVSGDGKTVLDLKDFKDFKDKFPGLEVDMSFNSQGQEQVNLSKIPVEMDGWDLRIKFVGYDDVAVYTNKAYIEVEELKVSAPKINTQPVGGEFAVGESVKLTVSASAADDGKLSYQWYATSTNDIATIRAIDGADTSSYTVTGSNAGKVYYCVGIWNKVQEKESAPTYSNLVPVSFAVAPVATTEPAVTEPAKQDTQPADQPGESEGITDVIVPAPTSSQKADEQPAKTETAKEKGGFSALSLVLVAIAAAAIAVAVVLVVIRVKANEEPPVYCRCDNCGWKSPRGKLPPKYCPRCGDEISRSEVHRPGTFRRQ